MRTLPGLKETVLICVYCGRQKTEDQQRNGSCCIKAMANPRFIRAGRESAERIRACGLSRFEVMVNRLLPIKIMRVCES